MRFETYLGAAAEASHEGVRPVAHCSVAVEGQPIVDVLPSTADATKMERHRRHLRRHRTVRVPERLRLHGSLGEHLDTLARDEAGRGLHRCCRRRRARGAATLNSAGRQPTGEQYPGERADSAAGQLGS